MKKHGAKKLGALIEKVSLAPNNKKGEWALIRLLLQHWAEIIGAPTSAHTTPVAISFPTPTERVGGTLTIACPAPLATELQHEAPVLLEKINRVFGYAAFARLAFVRPRTNQSGLSPARRATTPTAPIDTSAIAALPDEELQAALVRLANAINSQ